MNQVIALHSVAQIPTDPSPKWPSIRKVFHEKCCILLMKNISLQIEILSIDIVHLDGVNFLILLTYKLPAIL